jgi:hypothetical protein
MDEIILPARSYAEALPLLRRPYLPGQIRAKVLDAPDDPNAACAIALFAIGETPMDRFNLTCAEHWSRTFKTEAETRRNNYYYCRVKAIVVAFGVERDDIGEAIAETLGAALMNARAQAFKRASRWHGPGQCLYAAERTLLLRGEKDDELLLPEDGEDRHKRPYLTAAGQQNVRDKYAAWLTSDGEAIYGEPLDHLAQYEKLAQQDRRIVSTTATQPAIHEARQPPETANETSDPEPGATRSADVPPPTEMHEAPPQSATSTAAHTMPDEPASDATVEISWALGYDASAARALSNLARSEQQTGELSAHQQERVLNWLEELSELNITSPQILRAVEWVAARDTDQDTRQAQFERWLTAKTTTSDAPQRENPLPETQTAATSAAESAGGVDRESPPPEPSCEDTSVCIESPESAPELERERALRRVRLVMDTHGYSDRTVTQLAALLLGTSETGKVDWQTLSPQTMQVLAEPLENAGTLAWTPDRLATEVFKAQNGNQYSTRAGRFSALASQLADLVESRLIDAA